MNERPTPETRKAELASLDGTGCVTLLTRILNLFKPKQKHVWKETKRETLGGFMDFGTDPRFSEWMYRIAVYEECLLTGEKRIRQVTDFFPADEQ